jgi:cbb3-type cytochrome oxidase subunit 1
VSVKVVVNKTRPKQSDVSQVPHLAVLQFSKANSTSNLTDKTTQGITSSVSSYATAAVGGAAMITGSPSMIMNMLNTVQFIAHLPLMNLDIDTQQRTPRWLKSFR